MTFKIPPQKLRTVFAPLAFFVFTFVTAIVVVSFVIQERQSKRAMESLQVSMDLVSERLTHLKQRLAMDLSAELIQRKGTSLSSGEHIQFSAVGLLQIKDASLALDWMTKKGEGTKLSNDLVQDWLREVDPDTLKDKGSLFLVVNPELPHLVSIFPFQFGDQKAPVWGFAIESLPSNWLNFSRSQSLWIVDDRSENILSSFGGQYQGVKFENELKNLSESVAYYQAEGGEDWAWQKLKGSNLVVLWRQASQPWFATSIWWAFFVLAFGLGLIPFLKVVQLSPEPDDLTPMKESEVETPTPLPILAEVQTSSKVPTKMKKKSVTVESVVEESLLEPMFEPKPLDLPKLPDFELNPSLAMTEATDKNENEETSAFNEMISEAIKNQNTGIQHHGIRVNLLLAPNLVTKWPLTQLQSALEEVLKNSVEAMESTEVKTLTISAKQSPDYIEICVEDTGTGMTDEILARSMEAFFSTRPSGSRRRGLGLNVAKRLLEISGGRLRIESTPGVGTKVHFEVPNEPIEEVRTAKTLDSTVVRKPAVRV